MTGPQPIGAVLDATVAVDPARPILTYYDHAAEERVELSAATLRNWIDKTANLLVDVLAAGIGSRVSVALPTHWQGPVWLLACWRVGAVVVGEGARPDISVVGPDRVNTGTLPHAPEVVATSLHPLGAPFAAPLPPGITDYGAEVFAQADAFAAAAPVAADRPAWDDGGTVLDHTALLDRAAATAQRVGLRRGGRLLIDANPTRLEGAVAAVLAPLLVDGTVVLVRDLDPGRLPGLVATERVDVTAVGGPDAR